MKLCNNCKHSEVKVLPAGRPYNCCNKLSDQKTVVICLNAREKGSGCGPEAKHWESK